MVLVDLSVEGIPSEVVVVRSDDGGELNEGKIGRICREFITAHSP